MKTRDAFLTLLVLTALGLPFGAMAQSPPASQWTDFSGVWKGIRRHSSGNFTDISFAIQQTGGSIVGTAAWDLSPSGQGGTGGPMEGVVSEEVLKFKVPSVGFTGEVKRSGDELGGTLSGPLFYQLQLKRPP